jgi:SAM-dependent methyltransferase
MGALSRRLSDAGYRVTACDLFPEFFRVPEVECLPVDEDGTLPYQDQSIDVAYGVELVEHMENPGRFFKEAARVLKPGGDLIITTPNILSLKSRLGFLLTGYTYSFPPLDPDVRDPVRQHITPLTLDGYRWRLKQAGFDIVEVAVDKYQSTSLWASFLLPLVWIGSWRTSRESGNAWSQNQFHMLYGRTLMIRARRA